MFLSAVYSYLKIEVVSNLSSFSNPIPTLALPLKGRELRYSEPPLGGAGVAYLTLVLEGNCGT
jgi:hypothetical protein